MSEHGSTAPRSLPAAAILSLRQAFAGEVAARLPRLAAATAALLVEGAPGPAGQIAGDAHALASSATVIGENVAAHAARDCELLVSGWLTGREGSARPMPVALTEQVAGAAEIVCLALLRWLLAADAAA